MPREYEPKPVHPRCRDWPDSFLGWLLLCGGVFFALSATVVPFVSFLLLAGEAQWLRFSASIWSLIASVILSGVCTGLAGWVDQSSNCRKPT